MSDDENLTELSEAARRAGYIVTEQIDAILEKAEQQAEAIRRDAERDAEDTRRVAVEAAQRLLGRLEALEFPLGSLVASLRDEAEQVSRQLEEGTPVDAVGTALPSGPEHAQAIVEEADERPEPEHEDDEISENGRAGHGVGEAEQAQPRAFEEPVPPESDAQSASSPPASEDWKRWVIDAVEDDLQDRADQAASAPVPPASLHSEAGDPDEPGKRAFNRRRASKPRS